MEELKQMEVDKKEVKYYKVLNRDLTHNGFEYQLGLNEDIILFNFNGSCEKGGLYYTTKEYLSGFLDDGCYIADVSIPEDAQVYKDPQGYKWKADKIIIDKITWMGEHELWNDMEFLLTVNANNYDFSCLNCNDIHELFIKIQQEPKRLMFVKNQTKELCLLAVRKNGTNIRYVKEQTPELCMEAVKQGGLSLKYVKDQTPELCMVAVKRDGYNIQYVKEQTPELCMEAVKQKGRYLQYVKDQTPELCLLAVRKNGNNLKYVKNQTYDICAEALKNNPDAYEHIKDPVMQKRFPSPSSCSIM